MTSQYNTAEGGTNGTTPTTSDTGSGTALGVVTPGSVSIVKFSTAHPAHGSLGYKLANNTTTAEVAKLGQLDSGGGAASVFGSFYYTCDVAPSGTLRVIRFRKNGAGVVGGIFESSQNHLQIRQGNDANPPKYTFTAALTLGTIYRVEWNVIVDGSTSATIQVKLYLGDSATAIEDSTATTVTTTAAVSAVDLVEYGGGVTSSAKWPNSGTGAQYYDDLKSFYTTWTGAVATTDVSVTAVAASGTAAAGSFTSDVSIVPGAAVATASAVGPTPSATHNIRIAPLAAASTASPVAPVPAVSITATAASSTASASPPSFSTATNVTVAAKVSASTASSSAPTPELIIAAVAAGATASASTSVIPTVAMVMAAAGASTSSMTPAPIELRPGGGDLQPHLGLFPSIGLYPSSGGVNPGMVAAPISDGTMTPA